MKLLPERREREEREREKGWRGVSERESVCSSVKMKTDVPNDLVLAVFLFIYVDSIHVL